MRVKRLAAALLATFAVVAGVQSTAKADTSPGQCLTVYWTYTTWAHPGDTVDLQATVIDCGTDPYEYTVTPVAGTVPGRNYQPGWVQSTDPNSASLTGGQQVAETATVDVPADTPPGDYWVNLQFSQTDATGNVSYGVSLPFLIHLP